MRKKKPMDERKEDLRTMTTNCEMNQRLANAIVLAEAVAISMAATVAAAVAMAAVGLPPLAQYWLKE